MPNYPGLKVHPEFFYGINASGLAKITHNGTDEAAAKRRQIIEDWAHSGQQEWKQGRYRPIGPNQGRYGTFENKPISGWEIVDFCGAEFRIKDPRGFHIHIRVGEIMPLLLNGTVKDGKLVGKYVYGKDARYLTIVKAGSKAHEAGLANAAPKKRTTVNAMKIGLVQPGDHVRLYWMGVEYDVIYLGRIHRLQTTGHYDLPQKARKGIEHAYYHDQIETFEHVFSKVDSRFWSWNHNIFTPKHPKVLRVDKAMGSQAAENMLIKLENKFRRDQEPYLYRLHPDRETLETIRQERLDAGITKKHESEDE